MKSSDRSCCGAGRCRKLDSGTPVRVAFGGGGCACAERCAARLKDPAVAPVGTRLWDFLSKMGRFSPLQYVTSGLTLYFVKKNIN
jgi:hypothetical protein